MDNKGELQGKYGKIKTKYGGNAGEHRENTEKIQGKYSKVHENTGKYRGNAMDVQ